MIACDFCPDTYREELKEGHVDDVHDYLMFQCQLCCGSAFVYAEQLLSHLQERHLIHDEEERASVSILPLDARWMECKFCDRKFFAQRGQVS